MLEKRFWARLRVLLQDSLHMVRVTERLQEGVPDVLWQDRSSAACGWIELKSGSWIRMDQAAFLSSWVRHNGLASLVVWHEKKTHLYYARKEVGWSKAIVAGTLEPDIVWSGLPPAHAFTIALLQQRELLQRGKLCLAGQRYSSHIECPTEVFRETRLMNP